MKLAILKEFNQKLKFRIGQLEEAISEAVPLITEEASKLLAESKKSLVELLSKFSEETGVLADNFLSKLFAELNASELSQTLKQLATESEKWRTLVENAINTTHDSAIAFGRTAGNTFLYTSVSTFFGTVSRRAAAHIGCTEERQNQVEFAASALSGTAIAVGRKVNTLRPDALALRALTYVSLPMIQRGLEMGGYDASQALGYAACLKTALDIYQNPIDGLSTAAGFFAGNYAGAQLGEKAGEAVANVLFGPSAKLALG